MIIGSITYKMSTAIGSYGYYYPYTRYYEEDSEECLATDSISEELSWLLGIPYGVVFSALPNDLKYMR